MSFGRVGFGFRDPIGHAHRPIGFYCPRDRIDHRSTGDVAMTRETGNPKPKNRLPETRNPKPETIGALTAIVGPDHVITDVSALTQLARTTLPVATMPMAVVRPADAAQVQAVVQVARAHGLHLYPYSRGRNWGYGDRNAARDGAVLIDLGRMDAIHHVDAELGYAVIGPGVSQGQLFAHLRDHGLTWRMDCTGAGPDASIVGCMVERGYGHSRLGDRYANSAAWQLVLGDGRIVETGRASCRERV